MVDPTLGASNKGDKEIKRFIGDGKSLHDKICLLKIIEKRVSHVFNK